MAKLLEITGKAISGEWGQDDDTGTGIPVLRTTNFTNEGFVNYKNVVTRSISKKNIAEKYLRHGDVIIEKSGGSDKQPVGRVIFFEGEENKYLFNNFTGLLRVQNPEEWLPKYVFYALYALTKGLQYANQLHMSKQAIYDQLTSSYGEGFPADAARYAVDNMTDVDWNANALERQSSTIMIWQCQRVPCMTN